jgi:general L-amino acid transport system substrate-binding protein
VSRCWRWSSAGLVVLAAVAGMAHGGERLDEIRERGYLVCGITTEVAGFATVDEQGRYSGFEVDICRAVAAALFGSPERVNFLTAGSVSQFKQYSDIDVVARRLTWTLTREADHGLLFGPIIFFDGAAFLVPAGADIQQPQQLTGRPICLRGASETEQALAAYAQSTAFELAARPFAGNTEAARAFYAGTCDALAADLSELGAERAARDAGWQRYRILPHLISKEPLALLMRQGDEDFFLIVRWTFFALLEAEEFHVTQSNVDSLVESGVGKVRGLLGADTGQALGLDERWVADVIRAVGNYGEIFARHLGQNSPIKLERGLNRLWTSGGLMYAPPVR